MPLTVESPEGEKVHARSEPVGDGNPYTDLRVAITTFTGEVKMSDDPQRKPGARTVRLLPEDAERLAAKLIHSAAFARYMQDDAHDPNDIGGSIRMMDTLFTRLKEVLPESITERF